MVAAFFVQPQDLHSHFLMVSLNMATPLDVISLQQAKDFLVIDFPDRDAEITRHIKSAIGYIERYTNHMLYERQKQYLITSGSDNVEIYDFPLTLWGDTVNQTAYSNVQSRKFTGDDLVFDDDAGLYYLPLPLSGNQQAFSMTLTENGGEPVSDNPNWSNGRIYRLINLNEDVDITVYIVDSGSSSTYGNAKYVHNILSTTVYGKCGSTVMATVGYAVGEAPEELIEAAYKMIQYLTENKDIYTAGLPWDIQLLVNQYRRSATI